MCVSAFIKLNQRYFKKTLERPERNSFYSGFKLSSVLLMIVILVSSFGFSKDRSLRTLPVKIAIDSTCIYSDFNKIAVRRMIGNINRKFKRLFRLRFELVEFVSWQPSPGEKSLQDILIELRSKVPQENCSIVVGFVSPNRCISRVIALASYQHAYILMQIGTPIRTLSSMLTHEFCHLFGAVDLYEKRSIMGIKYPGNKFDDFTVRLIQINRLRSFNALEFPLSSRQIDKAKKVCFEIINQKKAGALLHGYLASLLAEKSDTEAALDEINIALKMNPDFKEMYIIIGNIYLGQGKLDQAISVFRTALNFFPELPELYLNLGLALLAKGFTDESESAFRKAVEINPFYAKPRANLGLIYLQKNMFDKAIAECRYILDIKPDFPEVLCTLSAALVLKARNEKKKQMKNYKVNELVVEAIIHCQRALVLRPDFAHLYNILGNAYDYQGNMLKAEAGYMKAINIRPDFAAAHFNLGILYLRCGDEKKSVRYLQKAVSLDPDFAEDYQVINLKYILVLNRLRLLHLAILY